MIRTAIREEPIKMAQYLSGEKERYEPIGTCNMKHDPTVVKEIVRQAKKYSKLLERRLNLNEEIAGRTIFI